MTVDQTQAVDQAKLEALLGRFVNDFGAAGLAATVVIGDKLGLYQALAAGPATPAELANRTSTHPRLVAEWLAAQAASGYVTYDPDGDRFSLSEEQAFALAHEDGPMYLPGAFQVMVAAVKDEPKVTQAFRNGAGVPWHEHDPELFVGTERFFRPAMPPTWSRTGSRPLMGSRPSSRRGPRWPTSAAAMALPPSSWPRPTPAQRSSASTTTSPPSSMPSRWRPTPGWPSAVASSSPPPPPIRAPAMTW
jgi:Rv2258c-like winged HTH domain